LNRSIKEEILTRPADSGRIAEQGEEMSRIVASFWSGTGTPYVKHQLDASKPKGARDFERERRSPCFLEFNLNLAVQTGQCTEKLVSYDRVQVDL
jgi:hypothetical protein